MQELEGSGDLRDAAVALRGMREVTAAAANLAIRPLDEGAAAELHHVLVQRAPAARAALRRLGAEGAAESPRLALRDQLEGGPGWR